MTGFFFLEVVENAETRPIRIDMGHFCFDIFAIVV